MKTISAFLLSLALALGSPEARAAERLALYVSNGGAQTISIFHLDPASGALEPRGTAALPGNPGPLAVSPNGKIVYAALRQNKSVQALHVNAADGALIPFGSPVVINVNAAYLFIDRTGRNLLTADYGGDVVAVHRIGEDGTVAPDSAWQVGTGRNPHSIQADPANRFVFAPLCGADKVLQFRFDPTSGKLEANDPPEAAFRPVDGPRHFAFHPKRNTVYVVNEKSSSVTALDYDAAKGALTPRQTLSTLPADAAVKNSCADIHVTPDGRYVYASNRGHDSLAGFSIDQATGQLTAVGHTPTEKTPRSFAIDPAGKFVFVGGQGSHQLAAYRLDAVSGALQPLKTYETEKGPAWVLILPLPGK